MVQAPDPSAAGNQPSFLLDGALTFGPKYSPKRISVTKKREVNRQENFCGGEDVTDLGSKNREIHVSGIILGKELPTFGDLLDLSEPLTLTMTSWTGEVQVLEGEHEGPVGLDYQQSVGVNSEKRDYLYKYSLDLVSTGLDESEYNSPQEELYPNTNYMEIGGQQIVTDGRYVGP